MVLPSLDTAVRSQHFFAALHIADLAGVVIYLLPRNSIVRAAG